MTAKETRCMAANSAIWWERRGSPTEEEDVRKLRVSKLGPNFPRPLDLFGNRGRLLGANGGRLDQKAERKDNKRSHNDTTRGGLYVRLSNAPSRAEGHGRFPEDAKLIKKLAYRLPTVNRTIATVRLAMPELSSSLAECEARCMV